MSEARGLAGDLRYGYQVAARLGGWRLVPIGHPTALRFELSSSVVRVYDPWCQYDPLDLRLQIGPNLWVWSDIFHGSVSRLSSTAPFRVELAEWPTIITEVTL